MTTPVPAGIRVSVWGELRGERRPPGPGVLRVLVDGQHAGAVGQEAGTWQAQVHDGLRQPGQVTGHETAEDAVRAILRSSWARKLGARAASHVYWTDRATRLAARNPRPASAPGSGPR